MFIEAIFLQEISEEKAFFNIPCKETGT